MRACVGCPFRMRFLPCRQRTGSVRLDRCQRSLPDVPVVYLLQLITRLVTASCCIRPHPRQAPGAKFKELHLLLSCPNSKPVDANLWHNRQPILTLSLRYAVCSRPHPQYHRRPLSVAVQEHTRPPSRSQTAFSRDERPTKKRRKKPPSCASQLLQKQALPAARAAHCKYHPAAVPYSRILRLQIQFRFRNLQFIWVGRQIPRLPQHTHIHPPNSPFLQAPKAALPHQESRRFVQPHLRRLIGQSGQVHRKLYNSRHSDPWLRKGMPSTHATSPVTAQP